MKYYTLITGGSSGIGRALAFECASRGMNLIIVALPGPELKQTADEIISGFPVEVRWFNADLSIYDGPKKVYDWCISEGFKVNFLINNASLAGTVLFEETDPEYSDVRIMLNIRGTVLLTRYFIPMLKEIKGSRILNVGSFSGFSPVPYKSVYSASKAFILSFSKSLGIELKKSGIQVSVVCPNGVDTNSRVSTIIDSHGFWGRITRISPSRLATITLESVEQGKRVIIPLTVNRFLFFLNVLIPVPLKYRILEKQFHKEMILQKQL